MDEDKKATTSYSWPVIILALCFFWPVGIFLIIRKISKEKRATLAAGKIINALSIVSYCIAVLCFLLCIAEKFILIDIIMTLFFGAAGFAFSLIAKKLKKESENIKQYLSIIINGRVRQLSTIASTAGKSYDVVYKDIKKMIDKGYLKNAYIDESSRKIILPNNSLQNHTNTTTRPKTITCHCCGAKNVIQDDISECEYCGSPLQ